MKNKKCPAAVSVIAMLSIITAAALGLVLYAAGLPLDLERIDLITGSPAFYDVNGKLFHLRLSPDSEWQIPVRLSEMGRWLPLVAVGAEDGRFYTHHGIDLPAIARAAGQNLLARRVVSGASTITSQLIRLAVSEPEHRPRSPLTKIREFILAFKLERSRTKDYILENYLNRAPFGGNIRGVQAASLIYFGKPAAKLSPGEACLLIGMLKGPGLYRPDTRPANAKRRRDAVIQLMERKGIFTRSEAQRARLEELPGRRFAMPFRAWHFTELVLKNHLNYFNSNFNFQTSLDLNLQTRLEAVSRQALSMFPRNVTLAAGIVRNEDAGLAAWVGNARFNISSLRGSAGQGTWVDCGLAPRSPGSTLKPFAYLSAIEQGLLTPGLMLEDSPVNFSGRAPRNFDRQYRGAVSAGVALADSLNAPAVRVLRMAGPERVLSLLRSSGFRRLTHPAGYYGDSMILGGCEVTLLEELEAFTMLASSGRHRPLKLLTGTESGPSEKEKYKENEKEKTKEGACWLVSEMLRRRDGLSGRQFALKTGTSYGLRDAWAVAYTPDYTVAVWVGAPDGESWHGLVGARAAAPVVAGILSSLPARRQNNWFPRPQGVTRRPVCSVSGLPPAAGCPSVRLDWSLEGVSRTMPCKLHGIQKAMVTGTGFEQAGQVQSKNKNQNKIFMPLTIVSPLEGSIWGISPFQTELRVPAGAEGAMAGPVWWYLDGRPSASVFASSSGFSAAATLSVPPGAHTLAVMDSAGRSASVSFTVRPLAPSAPLLR